MCGVNVGFCPSLPPTGPLLAAEGGVFQRLLLLSAFGVRQWWPFGSSFGENSSEMLGVPLHSGVREHGSGRAGSLRLSPGGF